MSERTAQPGMGGAAYAPFQYTDPKDMLVSFNGGKTEICMAFR